MEKEIRLKQIAIAHFSVKVEGAIGMNYTHYGLGEDGRMYAFHQDIKKWVPCVMDVLDDAESVPGIGKQDI